MPKTTFGAPPPRSTSSPRVPSRSYSPLRYSSPLKTLIPVPIPITQPLQTCLSNYKQISPQRERQHAVSVSTSAVGFENVSHRKISEAPKLRTRAPRNRSQEVKSETLKPSKRLSISSARQSVSAIPNFLGTLELQKSMSLIPGVSCSPPVSAVRPKGPSRYPSPPLPERRHSPPLNSQEPVQKLVSMELPLPISDSRPEKNIDEPTSSRPASEVPKPQSRSSSISAVDDFNIRERRTSSSRPASDVPKPQSHSSSISAVDDFNIRERRTSDPRASTLKRLPLPIVPQSDSPSSGAADISVVETNQMDLVISVLSKLRTELASKLKAELDHLRGELLFESKSNLTISEVSNLRVEVASKLRAELKRFPSEHFPPTIENTTNARSLEVSKMKALLEHIKGEFLDEADIATANFAFMEVSNLQAELERFEEVTKLRAELKHFIEVCQEKTEFDRLRSEHEAQTRNSHRESSTLSSLPLPVVPQSASQLLGIATASAVDASEWDLVISVVPKLRTELASKSRAELDHLRREYLLAAAKNDSNLTISEVSNLRAEVASKMKAELDQLREEYLPRAIEDRSHLKVSGVKQMTALLEHFRADENMSSLAISELSNMQIELDHFEEVSKLKTELECFADISKLKAELVRLQSESSTAKAEVAFLKREFDKLQIVAPPIPSSFSQGTMSSQSSSSLSASESSNRYQIGDRVEVRGKPTDLDAPTSWTAGIVTALDPLQIQADGSMFARIWPEVRSRTTRSGYTDRRLSNTWPPREIF